MVHPHSTCHRISYVLVLYTITCNFVSYFFYNLFQIPWKCGLEHITEITANPCIADTCFSWPNKMKWKKYFFPYWGHLRRCSSIRSTNASLLKVFSSCRRWTTRLRGAVRYAYVDLINYMHQAQKPLAAYQIIVIWYIWRPSTYTSNLIRGQNDVFVVIW
jgi:hypothetical protein